MSSSPEHPPRPSSGVPRKPVAFHTSKYGPELLVDIAWVRQMKQFILAEPHALAFYDITLITAGRGWFTLDGTRYRIHPGTVLFTAPGQIRVWQTTCLDGICLFFPRLFLDEFFTDTQFLERLGYFNPADGTAALTLDPRHASKLRSALDTMRRELGRLRTDSIHLLRARAYEILVTLARHYAAIAPRSAGRTPERRTQRYLALIERDRSRRQGVHDYARELAVSPGYLNTLCQRHLGRNAKQLIADRVILEARRQLLYSESSVDQVGTALGFKDPSYFSRFFRARTGKTPSEFRRQ